MQYVCLDAGEEVIAYQRDRTVRSHAAGVGAHVALAEPLVVLRYRKDLAFLPVGEREDGTLLALQELFDDNHLAGRAKAIVHHHGVDGVLGFGAGGAHHGALAGRQARCLDHQRLRVARHVGQRLVGVVECARLGGGNARAAHDVFGEGLGRFDPGAGRGGPEDRMAGCRESVGQAGRQRRFRPYDGQVDPVVAGRVDQAVKVVRGDGEVAGELGRAGIAGGAEDFDRRVVAAEGPSESMLPPSAADDQELHSDWPFRKASPTFSAAFLAASTT